ncbi:DoxX family membrane protein [Maribacter sp. 2304DJ31-5]|uniref:DoxX family membrane protein n=1 Tax=Maribacter sp. 2304DJ31-5 TaxID=3386273 RepID=UPI0039BD9342
MQVKKLNLLRYSIGIIYLWFGVLKFFPELSPAESLAKETISILTFGLVPQNISYITLAVWEVLIGILLLLNIYLRIVVVAALIHMLGTFMPLIVVADTAFNELPMTLTLVGQYIMKNLVIASGLLLIYPGENMWRVFKKKRTLNINDVVQPEDIMGEKTGQKEILNRKIS